MPPPIIDTHQHLWDLDRFRLDWTQSEPRLARNHLPGEYLDETEGLGIAKSIYMEVDMAPEQHFAEVEFIADLCKAGNSTLVAAVVAGRPETKGFGNYLQWLGDFQCVRGVRRVLHVDETPPGYCLQAEFIDGVRQLSEADLSFDICIRRQELADAAKLIDACPNVRFVLDHCGNADVRCSPEEQAAWRRDLAEIARRPNVVCKVSGFIWTAHAKAWTVEDDVRPIVAHTIDCFGPDRVMFGSDWPVCTLAATLRQWVGALREAVSDAGEELQRKLFYENAAKFYRLA